MVKQLLVAVLGIGIMAISGCGKSLKYDDPEYLNLSPEIMSLSILEGQSLPLQLDINPQYLSASLTTSQIHPSMIRHNSYALVYPGTDFPLNGGTCATNKKVYQSQSANVTYRYIEMFSDSGCVTQVGTESLIITQQNNILSVESTKTGSNTEASSRFTLPIIDGNVDYTADPEIKHLKFTYKNLGFLPEVEFITGSDNFLSIDIYRQNDLESILSFPFQIQFQDHLNISRIRIFTGSFYLSKDAVTLIPHGEMVDETDRKYYVSDLLDETFKKVARLVIDDNFKMHLAYYHNQHVLGDFRPPLD